MSLTRKHFIELAEIFKQHEPKDPATVWEHELWIVLRERIALFCAGQNSNFDYDRFMKASESHDN